MQTLQPAGTKHDRTIRPALREVGRFGLNHPKNYLGVPLAAVSATPTMVAIDTRLVSCPDRAVDGATALDLVTADSELTALGTTIVEMVAECSSVDTELQRFEALKGSTKRFIDVVPPFWRSIATYVFRHHPITGDIVGLLEETGSTTLAELAQTAVETGHPAAESLFRDPDVVTPQAGSQTTDPNRFADASVYAGCAVYQLKTNLYHVGILTERGADTSALVPKQDYWAIEPSHIDYENAKTGGDH